MSLKSQSRHVTINATLVGNMSLKKLPRHVTINVITFDYRHVSETHGKLGMYNHGRS
jgi:hypothetical protein